MLREIGVVLIFMAMPFLAESATIEKELIYKNHVLPDRYEVNIMKEKMERQFDWKKINQNLDNIERFLNSYTEIGNLHNLNDSMGAAPSINGTDYDDYGVQRKSAIPLYASKDEALSGTGNFRYGRDGALFGIVERGQKVSRIRVKGINGEWYTDNRYLQMREGKNIDKIIFVDTFNQNSATLERAGEVWKVRSMVPITTGIDSAPLFYPTPDGVYFVQDRVDRNILVKPGTDGHIEGYAPWAVRFTSDIFLQGLPVFDLKNGTTEYLPTLGTKPLSHWNVRNPTSHSYFLYEWAKPGETLVYVL